MVKHEIKYAKHPNGSDIEVQCSCGETFPARNPTDANNVARNHIKLAEAKEELDD